MPSWQERITRETAPAIRVEHDLRYRAAASAIRESAVWCDLGCGNGIAAASAIGGRLEGRAVLVDLAAEAVASAEREIEAAETVALTADLTSGEDLARIREALLAGEPDAPRTITCFEVVEHLSTFVPLLEWLSELATAHRVTVFLSVPNDAFWAIENPHHHTMWGEGAFEELRRLLPAGHVLARQVELHGSAIVPLDGDGPARLEVGVEVDAGRVPTHFLAAFGPGARALSEPRAGASPGDLEERRRWERQRESDLAYLEQVASELPEWRAYIHELEGKLGLPLSGVEGPDPEPTAPDRAA